MNSWPALPYQEWQPTRDTLHIYTQIGFWPGQEQYPAAAFFAYAAPKPDGIEAASIRPAAAGGPSSTSWSAPMRQAQPGWAGAPT